MIKLCTPACLKQTRNFSIFEIAHFGFITNFCLYNNDISEFDSVVAAARKIKSNDGMDKWVFRTFHPSIDTVSIASEKTNTNHFVTMFEKGELDSKNMNDLNNEVFKFYRKTS